MYLLLIFLVNDWFSRMYPVDIHLNEHLMTGVVFFFNVIRLIQKRKLVVHRRNHKTRAPNQGQWRRRRQWSQRKVRTVCESFVIYQEQRCVEVGVPWGMPKQGKPDNLWSFDLSAAKGGVSLGDYSWPGCLPSFFASFQLPLYLNWNPIQSWVSSVPCVRVCAGLAGLLPGLALFAESS